MIWVHHSQPEYQAVTGYMSVLIWGKTRPMPDGTALLITHRDKALGAVLFHNWHPDHGTVEISIASTSPRWLTKKTIRAMADYVFNTLKAQAGYMRVDARRTDICRQLEACGFLRVDVPHMRGKGLSEAFFIMGVDEWSASPISEV